MLAHHLTQNPTIVLGDDTRPDGDILELGAGCGLVGLTAATMLQNQNNGTGQSNDDKVIFTDYNPEVLDNLKRNIRLNEFDTAHEVYGLDWFDQQSDDVDAGVEAEDKEKDTWLDMEGTSRPQCRLILGADLLVCSNDADLVASTIDAALMKGGQAIILGPDADTRFGVSSLPDACTSLGLTVLVHENILESREEENSAVFMSELELAGYNLRASTYGHDFTMFIINKPIASA